MTPTGAESTRAGGLPPVDRSTLDDETDALLSLAVNPAGDVVPAVQVIANSGKLLGPFLTWAAALHFEGVLSDRHHEILALRTSHNLESSFEWAEHVGWATKAGLTDAEITAVAAGPEGWPATEAALIRLADELHEQHNASDATLATVVDALDVASAVEAVLVVGQYSMLCGLCAAARLDATDAGPTG